MMRFYVPNPPLNSLQPRPTVATQRATAICNTLSPNPRAQLKPTLLVRTRDFRVAFPRGELAQRAVTVLPKRLGRIPCPTWQTLEPSGPFWIELTAGVG